MENIRPIGKKAYGSIPHLLGSRIDFDKHISAGQDKILTETPRDKKDRIIVQEKLDGSCCSIARLDNGNISALTRAGYLAGYSPFDMHKCFAFWVRREEKRFKYILSRGQRIIGEWMYKPHGTIYHMPHIPFVAFDIMEGTRRLPYDQFKQLIHIYDDYIPIANLLHDQYGIALSIASAREKLIASKDIHGAQGLQEGAVWRAERNGEVSFLAKYVSPDKVDGCFLNDDSVCNTWEEKIVELKL
jgi:hypothetical protein